VAASFATEIFTSSLQQLVQVKSIFIRKKTDEGKFASIGCIAAVCGMNSAAAAAVCGARQYASPFAFATHISILVSVVIVTLRMLSVIHD